MGESLFSRRCNPIFSRRPRPYARPGPRVASHAAEPACLKNSDIVNFMNFTFAGAAASR
jgi:hypothetical protein